MDKEVSKSGLTSIRTMSAALHAIQENGGSMSSKQVVDVVAKRLSFSDWEKEVNASNHPRWYIIMTFKSVDYVKAGYLIKKKGVWYITPEGENALKTQTPEQMARNTTDLYKKWLQSKKASEQDEQQQQSTTQDETMETMLNLEELESQAMDGIQEFIRQKNPYEFQDLVAALLRAMDYYTPFVAPKGKDGGIDIIAYLDPLGAKTPRIKVQVKHYPDTPISAPTIRSLVGILRDGDIGLCVTSGNFSPDARREAGMSKEYVKLIDGHEFITLWQQYYSKMPDEDKNLLPLRSIAFLGTNE